MNKQASSQTRIDAAFQQIAGVMRREEHNDASIFRDLAKMCEYAPAFASVLAHHLADVLDNSVGEVQYTEAYVEAYRRSLFDREQSQKYGYACFGDDVEFAEKFAASVAAGETANIVIASTMLQ